MRWLDRYRRPLAIAVAALIGPLVITELCYVLGADWPALHIGALGLMLGVVVWAVFETVLAALTAYWETDLSHLLRAVSLPSARIVKRRN